MPNSDAKSVANACRQHLAKLDGISPEQLSAIAVRGDYVVVMIAGDSLAILGNAAECLVASGERSMWRVRGDQVDIPTVLRHDATLAIAGDLAPDVRMIHDGS